MCITSDKRCSLGKKMVSLILGVSKIGCKPFLAIVEAFHSCPTLLWSNEICPTLLWRTHSSLYLRSCLLCNWGLFCSEKRWLGRDMTNLSFLRDHISLLSSRWHICLVQLGIISYIIECSPNGCTAPSAWRCWHMFSLWQAQNSNSSPWIHQVTVLHISRAFHPSLVSSSPPAHTCLQFSCKMVLKHIYRHLATAHTHTILFHPSVEILRCSTSGTASVENLTQEVLTFH